MVLVGVIFSTVISQHSEALNRAFSTFLVVIDLDQEKAKRTVLSLYELLVERERDHEPR